jgi:hypothetical protein
MAPASKPFVGCGECPEGEAWCDEDPDRCDAELARLWREELTADGICLDCGERWCSEHDMHYADCACVGDDRECPECHEWAMEDGGWCVYCGRVTVAST